MFKYFTLFLLAFILYHTAQAQSQYAFKVTFNNKDKTSFDLSNPSLYLSGKSLTRRSVQSIPIDSSDLPVVQSYIDSVLNKNVGTFHSKSKWQNNFLFLVADTTYVNLCRSYSFVQKIELVAIFLSPLHSISPTEKTAPDQNKNTGLLKVTGGLAYYGDAYDQIHLANGDYLHDKGFRGKNKTIAVLDAGFNLVNSLPGFDSLRKTGRIIDSYNFNLNNNDIDGYSSHGTQVLSTMAGIINSTYVGTAPDANYALYITENNESEQPFEMDNLVAAMERADSIGADIISISLGYNTFNMGTIDRSLTYANLDGKSTVAAKAANTATQKGILVVASAGNEGNGTWEKILTPGDADSALTCGSVDINKIIAPTSGKGPNSAGIRKPDVCMLGAPGIVLNNTGTTSSVGGTSIATPELAGLAACLWESKPTASPFEIRKAIKESAHIASSPNNNLGYGVPDFGNAYKKLTLSKVNIDSQSKNIYCYPNPFKDKINLLIIGNRAQENISWMIRDVQGRKIQQGELADNSISIIIELPLNNQIPLGTYFLQVKSSEFQKSFVIQRVE